MSNSMEGPKMDEKLAVIMAKIKAEHPNVGSLVSEQVTEPLSSSDLEKVRRLADTMFDGNMQKAKAFYLRPAGETRTAQPEMIPPPTTAAASKQISKMQKKNKPRDFPTFIERSLPPGDRE